MDTERIEAIEALRNDIAEIEKEQKGTKEQRKSERYTGERTMSPYAAAETARHNKHKLRLMYAAYGLLKGHNFGRTESEAKPIDRDFYYQRYGMWLNQELVGLHPLTIWLSDIADILREYGYDFKNYIEKKDYRDRTIKYVDPNSYEEIICIGEQKA